MAEGNRKDPRARVLNMTVRYKSATVDEFIENHSHDISRGGMFIKTRSPFPAGTLLKFEVRIAEDQKLMQGVGRVVWRRDPERAEEGFPAGMGIKFIKIGEGAAELIAQIVSARQGQESSFEAGARESGEAGSGLRSVPPTSGVEAAAPAAPGPSSDGPALQVESGPPSLPVEGETHVSTPAKKRQGQPEETRKVVLQPAAFDASTTDKSSPRVVERKPVAATPIEERAPNRPAPPKKRGSIVDETTTPRARVRSAAPPNQSSPSLYGLAAILGLVGATVWFVNRSRDPEPVNPPPAAKDVTVTAEPPVAPSPPVAPTPPPSSAAAPAANAAAATLQPVAAQPSVTAEPPGNAAKEAAGTAAAAVVAPTPTNRATAPVAPSSGPNSEAVASGQAKSMPALSQAPRAPAIAAKPAASPAPPAQKPAPSPPLSSSVTKPPVPSNAAAKAPAAPPKPAVAAKPPVAAHGTPSGENSVPQKPAASTEANAGRAAPAAGGAPSEAPAAKKPPAAAGAPGEAAPAPKAPSDDNPY